MDPEPREGVRRRVIDSGLLLADLRLLVGRLTDNLRERASEGGPVADVVLREYSAARAAGRTAQSESAWREDLFIQGAVAWALSCVFVRFLEDCGLVDEVWLSGPGSRREVARGRRRAYFAEHPTETDREVLWAAFRAASSSPAVAPLFDEQHNLVWRLPISGDAAREVVELWDRIDPDADDVRLRHDFTDPDRDTRFLGDLYQEVSEDARDKYALLQTPEFIESFILDRTFEPALAEFGLDGFKLIDPTCGSGHFLIGAFRRLLAAWRDHEPGTEVTVLAGRALRSVHGVDINPYAAAIARFRLTIEALNSCGIRRVVDAPGWEIRVACGDSLLHGPERGQLPTAAYGSALVREGLEHHYLTEDAEHLAQWLRPGYHLVIGNPPYITVKDKALNRAYRARYATCHREYQLTAPFMERFFDLAQTADGRGGWVGQITGSAFMKREFGSKLVEDFFPTIDLQTVIDTSRAHIPGHGTPTVILVGRMRPPVLATVRAVMGIRGEPSPPDNPAHGFVWRQIVEQLDHPGSESAYVSVDDVDREIFADHPWTVSGGGAVALRRKLEGGRHRLASAAAVIGTSVITGEDEAFLFLSERDARRAGAQELVKLVEGRDVRDWSLRAIAAVWTYDEEWRRTPMAADERLLWRSMSWLKQRKRFGQPMLEQGYAWFEWREIYPDKHRSPLTITWGEVATHNHFVLDRGGKVFKQTAPVIKLPRDASEADHFEILGALNSSTACFWLKQVCQPKGGGGIGRGVTVDAWEHRYALNATNVKQLPLADTRRPELSAEMDRLAASRAERLESLPRRLDRGHEALEVAARADRDELARMVALQEELDWQALAAYGLVSDELPQPGLDAPPLGLGERAFEIVLARNVAAGKTETTWFERHGSSPITELPDRWPAEYRAVVDRRIGLIEGDRDIGLVERPENKRRWDQPSWKARERRAMRAYLLDRVEDLPDWQGGQLLTCAQLTDRLRGDARVELAAQRYVGSMDVDLERVLTALVEEESVPYVAARRHTEAGLRTRAEWEHTWGLQRRGDAGEAIDDVPVPSKYNDKDWLNPRFKQLRSKLDVPRERFTSVPDGQRAGDPSPLVGWAGWDHVTLAFALASRFSLVRNEEGAGADRLVPLLAGLHELLPWVRQWHAEPDPDTGQPPHVELEGFLTAELARLGQTQEELLAWRPPAPVRKTRTAKMST
jgi:hypothetical protein